MFVPRPFALTLRRLRREGTPLGAFRWTGLPLLPLLVAGAVPGWVAAAPSGAVHYPAQPAASEGLVCVSDAGVRCFRDGTLELAWSALEGAHTLEPVIADGRLLVGSSAGLYALDTDTGEVLWHRPGAGLTFTPTVVGATAYASDRHGHLTAVDTRTGKSHWQRAFEGWSYPPAMVDGVLVTGGRSGLLRGIDPDTGATRWRRDFGSELVYRPVATAQGALVTGFAGRVAAIAADGAVTWSVRDKVASFTPAVAGDRALFGGMDGRIRVRALHDGGLLWQRSLGGNLVIPPRPEGRSIGVVNSDGHAVVLRRADGELEASTEVRGAPLGAPVRLSDDRWAVIYRRADGRVAHRELRIGNRSADSGGSAHGGMAALPLPRRVVRPTPSRPASVPAFSDAYAMEVS